MEIVKNVQNDIRDELENKFFLRDFRKKGYSIDEYRSKFMGGNARAYLFLCHINFPGIQNAIKSGLIGGMGGISPTTANESINIGDAVDNGIMAGTKTAINIGGMELGTKDFKFYVRSTTLPETTLEETSTYFCGNQYKVSSVRRSQDWSVSFNVNHDASIIKKFWSWHLAMHNPETGIYGKPSDYQADQQIQLLGLDGSVICTYTLYGAWPKTIGAVSLDYATNEFAQVDITFSYQYHTITGKSEPEILRMGRKMGSSITSDYMSGLIK